MADEAVPVVFELDDHLTAFYVGRELTGRSPFADVAENWVDAGAWALGAATYVLHEGQRAIVYDTTTLPELGRWVRDFLRNEKGIEHFTVVLSHWHLDHIAGNASYRDCSIIALDSTRRALVERRAAIESGRLWGPPPLEVVLPDVTFRDRLEVHLGDLRVELHHFEIHSRDGNLMYVPSEKRLFAGDALEDTVTYVVEPGDIPTHVAELHRLSRLEIDAIYPNHGDPDVIRSGGYAKSLIDATIEYDTNMLSRVQDSDYLELQLEELIPTALSERAVSVWEPYRAVHRRNLELVREYYEDRPPPLVG